jgi:glycosyl transferase, family 25
MGTLVQIDSSKTQRAVLRVPASSIRDTSEIWRDLRSMHLEYSINPPTLTVPGHSVRFLKSCISFGRSIVLLPPHILRPRPNKKIWRFRSEGLTEICAEPEQAARRKQSTGMARHFGASCGPRICGESVSADFAAPAFIINLDRDRSRWQNIAGALGQAGIPYHRVPAIDARKRINLIRRAVHRAFVYVPASRNLTDAEVGCYLSHISALKRVVRQNLAAAMIFEDDVVFDSEFTNFYRNDLPKFLAASDIVKFEGIHYSHTSKSGIPIAGGNTCQLVLRMKPTLGAAAYAVTRNGALALLKAASDPDRPFDHKLAYYDRHWIDYAETEPFLASQASYTSNLEHERKVYDLDNGLSQRLRRLRYRLSAPVRATIRLAYVAKFLIKQRIRKPKQAPTR